MKSVKVNASREYEVKIGSNLLSKIGDEIANVKKICKVLIVSDDTVHDLYGAQVYKSLKGLDYNVYEYTFEHGEKSKNLNTYSDILNFLGENEFVRSDLIIALGGGVVGDLAGFVASTYMRGIDYVQVPTTLLAMIDSSVGGKTAVDLKYGKNLVGCFYQPILVIEDTTVLETLPCSEYKNGLGEGVKYAVLEGGELMTILQSGLSCSKGNVDRFIELCVESKKHIVEQDEKENGIRRLLNLGHTMGHAIEKLSNYTISHGICVAKGLKYILDVSKAQNKITNEDYNTICELIKQYDFNCVEPYEIKDIIEAIKVDKKVDNNEINLVVPYGIADCRVEKIELNKLKEYIKC